MSPVALADALLDALEREGLVPGAFDWERRARRVIAEELERIGGFNQPTEDQGMFHLKDNHYFGRKLDGSVRILRFSADATKFPPGEWPDADEPYPEALFDLTVEPDGWASIVASVSVYGEADGRFYEARRFHG